MRKKITWEFFTFSILLDFKDMIFADFWWQSRSKNWFFALFNFNTFERIGKIHFNIIYDFTGGEGASIWVIVWFRKKSTQIETYGKWPLKDNLNFLYEYTAVTQI